MREIAVLGAGSWGTALAVHCAREGHPVTLWSRREDLARRLRAERANEEYLPGVELPEAIVAVADLDAVAEHEICLLVVPSHGFREVVRDLLARRRTTRPLILISGTKGVEANTLTRMSQVCFEEGVAATREVRFAVLSGPTFAAELAAGMPSAAVVASDHGELAATLREELAGPSLRLYSSSDVVGVELGGASKNVIAIAAGVLTGLGLGHNTLAALLTRGLHEITRLGLACGGQVRTFAGLAGMGDLVLTCTGSLSRNRRAGLELAAGRSLDEISGATSMVAEGIRNSLSIHHLATQRGVEMPITREMVEVIHRGKPPRRAIDDLMRRELKSETEL